MARKSYSLELIERLAAGKDIAFIQVVYDKSFYKSTKHIPTSHSYLFKHRNRIRWDMVVKCRLDFKVSKWYNVDGDGCERPGFKINPE